MSKEQWGHGYWKGRYDEKYGLNSQCSFADTVETLISILTLSNLHKDSDRSLCSISTMFVYLYFCGLDPKEYARKIYDFIIRYKPLGAYISGYPQDNWTEDYIVLPIHLSEEALMSIIDGKEINYGTENN